MGINAPDNSPQPDSPASAQSVLEWVGHPDCERVVERLVAFHGWLESEAVEGGGIGPDEVGRLWRRHIADSLTFLAALDNVEELLDLGSGVGLPGIPLAVALPDTEVLLLDRSERRCWLARRAVRILELANVEVIQTDVRNVSFPHRAIVSRATMSPTLFFETARRILPNCEVAVVSGSHGSSEPVDGGWEVVRVPARVLGQAAWLAKVSLSALDTG